jgi:hypothetical protein
MQNGVAVWLAMYLELVRWRPILAHGDSGLTSSCIIAHMFGYVDVDDKGGDEDDDGEGDGDKNENDDNDDDDNNDNDGNDNV